jgi:hypothetical protein
LSSPAGRPSVDFDSLPFGSDRPVRYLLLIEEVYVKA